MESTNPAFGRAVVRVNVFRHHRQTVQYIQPQHHAKLAQARAPSAPLPRFPLHPHCAALRCPPRAFVFWGGGLEPVMTSEYVRTIRAP